MEPSADTTAPPHARLPDRPEPSDTIVEQIVRCLACGYDLMGMRTDARCPECGFDIGESARPEICGFGGLMMLQRFRIALWMLALQPLVLLVCGVLRMPNELRYQLIDFAARPRPAVHTPQFSPRGPRWERIRAFTNQQYRQRWEQMSEYLDLLLLAAVVVTLGFTMVLLCARNHDAKIAARTSFQTPRMMAIRTAAIAFGVIVALTPIPLAITWQLTWTWTDSMLGPLGMVVPASIWLLAALLGWWAVSLVASGRLRVAFVGATSMLLIGGFLSLGGTSVVPIDVEIAHTIIFASLGLLALGAGLLWRWYAVGFGHKVLALLATGFAGAGPAMIVVSCGSLDPTISAGLLELRPGLAWFMLTASAIWACCLGITVAWRVYALRQRIQRLR